MERPGKMPFWQKVHIASTATFFFGIVALLVGDQWAQVWPQVTVPLGLALCFAGGGTGIITGIVLVMTPGFRL